jgi:hypothetical protein
VIKIKHVFVLVAPYLVHGVENTGSVFPSCLNQLAWYLFHQICYVSPHRRMSEEAVGVLVEIPFSEGRNGFGFRSGQKDNVLLHYGFDLQLLEHSLLVVRTTPDYYSACRC